MTDQAIVALYWARSQEALAATVEKYGSYCRPSVPLPGRSG